MSQTAIRVENLSKRYVIKHGSGAGSLKELAEHYRRLITRKFIHIFSLYFSRSFCGECLAPR